MNKIKERINQIDDKIEDCEEAMDYYEMQIEILIKERKELSSKLKWYQRFSLL